VSAEKQRLKIIVAYDGAPFSGWQSQITRDSVQDNIEAAIQKITGMEIRLHGSGRTDAGVHALGQVAHFDAPLPTLPTERWQMALNSNLPPTIRVLRVTKVRGGKDGFHARFSATGKRYTYRVCADRFIHPMEIGRVWHVPFPLDLERLREAAQVLEGKHDFAGFSANRGEPEKDTVRTIRKISIVRRGPLLALHFEGDGFLYKMVRILTASLMRVAQGKADTDWLRSVLNGGPKSQFAAPPEGLFMVKVLYK
jgi:tRNA pseudouridine38-40 synthase